MSEPARPFDIISWIDPEDRSLRADILRKKLETEARLRELDDALAQEEGEAARPYSPPAGLWLGYDEMLGERRAIGSRFATGLGLLDKKLEGGLYAGTVCAIQGPPGAGKTGMATQFALSLARAGCAVGALYADEGLSGAAVMLGQQLGADRVPLMAGKDAAARVALAGAAALPFFRAMRPSHRDATLEEFARGFDAIAPPGMQRVWLLDSAQTIRGTKGNGGRESQFDRIARTVEMVRDLTLSLGAITLLVSRVNRTAYAKKKDDDKGDPLGVSWGVALEYFVELLINLEGKPTVDKPRVTLIVSKNRISALGNFVLPLDMDYPRHGFREVDEEEDEKRKAEVNLAAVAEMKQRILDILTGREGVTGPVLRKEVGGKTQTIIAARKELQVEGRVYSRKKKDTGKEEWFATVAPSSFDVEKPEKTGDEPTPEETDGLFADGELPDGDETRGRG